VGLWGLGGFGVCFFFFFFFFGFWVGLLLCLGGGGLFFWLFLWWGWWWGWVVLGCFFLCFFGFFWGVPLSLPHVVFVFFFFFGGGCGVCWGVVLFLGGGGVFFLIPWCLVEHAGSPHCGQKTNFLLAQRRPRGAAAGGCSGFFFFKAFMTGSSDSASPRPPQRPTQFSISRTHDVRIWLPPRFSRVPRVLLLRGAQQARCISRTPRCPEEREFIFFSPLRSPLGPYLPDQRLGSTRKTRASDQIRDFPSHNASASPLCDADVVADRDPVSGRFVPRSISLETRANSRSEITQNFQRLSPPIFFSVLSTLTMSPLSYPAPTTRSSSLIASPPCTLYGLYESLPR